MPNLAKHAELVQDNSFRTRVQAAAVQAAIGISGESTDESDRKSVLRQSFATKVINGVQPVDGLAWAVGANATILGAYVAGTVTDVSDNDIEFVIASVWDDVSGAAGIA